MDDYHFTMEPRGSASGCLLPILFFLIFTPLAMVVGEPGAIGLPLILLFVFISSAKKKNGSTRVEVNGHELTVLAGGKVREVNVHEIYCARKSLDGGLKLKNEDGRTVFSVTSRHTNFDRFLLYLRRSGVELPDHD